MGNAAAHQVTNQNLGWWGRLGIWIAQRVFGLEMRSAPEAESLPKADDVHNGRRRDYLIIESVDTSASPRLPAETAGTAEAQEAEPYPVTGRVSQELQEPVPHTDAVRASVETVKPVPSTNISDGPPADTEESSTAIAPREDAAGINPPFNGARLTTMDASPVDDRQSDPIARIEPQTDNIDEPAVVHVAPPSRRLAPPATTATASGEDKGFEPPAVQNRQARRAGRRAALRPLRSPAPTTSADPIRTEATPADQGNAVEAAVPIENASIEDAILDIREDDAHLSDARILPARPRRPRYETPQEEIAVGFANAIDMHKVLDTLPQYFERLKLLRDIDVDAYALFSTLGGQIALDDGTRFYAGGVSPEFIAEAPHVRCVFLHGDVDDDGVTEDDRVPASIMYMMKLAGGQVCVNGHSIAMLPKDGLSYRFVTVFQYKGKPHAQSCFIHIDDEGRITALRERQRVLQAIPGRFHQNSPATIRHSKFKIPGWIAEAAMEHDEKAEDWIASVVSMCASAKRPDNAILVRAHKAGVAAAWTINRRDAKRFFAAREHDQDGRRRRVLHYVTSFDRETVNGIQNVREHYRGARAFEWQGYDIEVSGLDFHHKDFFNAKIDQYEEEDGKPNPAGMVSLKTLVKNVAAIYRRPVKLSKPRRKAA